VVLFTLALSGILVLYERTSLLLVPLALISTTVSAGLISWSTRLIDPKSISSLRRILGLLIVSTAIWLIAVLVAVPVTFALKNALANEFMFGAFLAWSFELTVINGVFLRSLGQSLVISAIHPIPIVLAAVLLSPSASLAIPVPGVVAILMILVFLVSINRLKTKNGIHSLEVLRAFLKTWVVKDPSELETFFSAYAKKDTVSTDVLIAQARDKKTALVVPGVHPGPFAPVGSYNVSELIHDDLKKSGAAAVVLHGTGGHERNVPANNLAKEYAETITKFVNEQKVTGRPLMRGPQRSTIGITRVTTLVFGHQALTIVSNAPYLSDDLDPVAIAGASGAADDLGLRLTVVDAHNSVDGKEAPQETIPREEWLRIFNQALRLPETEFKIGVATSNDTDFQHGSDISDGGISVVVLASEKSKHALVSVDSNNAKSGLREKVEEEIRNHGMEFLDLCTSDTHKLAARNRTSRGYFALGEQTTFSAITDCIGKLAKKADDDINGCTFLVARLDSSLPLIGQESLNDFARLTGRAFSLTKTFAKVILPSMLLLLAISLFY